MNRIPEPYILASRADLTVSHIIHRNGHTILCSGAMAKDWTPAMPDDKPVCSRCLAALEDREYRSRWVRDGGGSGMGRTG